MNIVVVLKLVNVFLLASVKYFFSFPYALIIGLNFEQAIISVLVGGIAGFFFFYYLSGLLIRAWQQYQYILCKLVPQFVKMKYRKFCEVRSRIREKKPVYTQKPLAGNHENKIRALGHCHYFTRDSEYSGRCIFTEKVLSKNEKCIWVHDDFHCWLGCFFLCSDNNFSRISLNF